MKKVIKYIFITLLVLIILLIIFVLASVNSINAKTTKGKEYSHTVVNQVSTYYTIHEKYPEHLNELDIFNDPKFSSYVNAHAFRYSTYSNNGPKYALSWRAGPMNWTGYRCTNDTLESAEKDQQVVRSYRMTGEVVCFVSDLH